GAFREDLLYRLNVFTIFVPPLRERKTDVLLLADHFLERLSSDHRKRIRRISTPAIDMLMAYHWPGNVRELQNDIKRAVLVCDGDVVHAHHLPPTLQMADTSDAAATQPLAAALAAYEKDLIQDALKMARGNRAKAARLLHATARIVNYKIRKYRIDWRRFRYLSIMPASHGAAVYTSLGPFRRPLSIAITATTTRIRNQRIRASGGSMCVS